MKVIRIGVDLAKNVFQVHGVDRFEKPVWRKKLSRTDYRLCCPPKAQYPPQPNARYSESTHTAIPGRCDG
jgi:hypothetical protein